jgi:DNA repair exonuclease SbcCD ATPase subunit
MNAYSDDTTQALESGEDLARKALEAADELSLPADTGVDAEVAASDQLAETLTHLQSVIERNVSELKRLKEELKLKRESLKSVFENDTELGEAQAQAEVMTKQLKERKAALQSNPQSISLKTQIAEVNQEKKEVEEALNNHLLNYYSMTNSMSIDTSDGDQLEFKVRASIKSV